MSEVGPALPVESSKGRETKLKHKIQEPEAQ